MNLARSESEFRFSPTRKSMLTRLDVSLEARRESKRGGSMDPDSSGRIFDMKVDIVRAWKDPEYRESLGREAPKNPAGLIELTDDELKSASGILAAAGTTCMCCTDTNRPRRCCP